MVRNDYRRALILLRSNAAEYSGHVRLERRTLMGSMYFVLQAPEDVGVLEAVLVGRGKDAYYACRLGAFRRDMRGQVTLGWNFNPRDVCGRELEQYQKIVVARREGSDCRIVLFGNINGFAEMNWERVRTAVCLSLQDGLARSGDTIEPRSEAAPPVQEDVPEEAQVEPQICTAEEAPQKVIIEETYEPANPQMEPLSAAEAAGLNTDLPWPEHIEGLRSIFRTQAPLEDAPDDSYTYISAPMPAGSGYEECAIGLQAENGMPAAVCYALRSHYTTQPPAGMEDYVWCGNGNVGWWRLETGVQG